MDRIEYGIQPYVWNDAVHMYDRYVKVVVADRSCLIMSFPDFLNQLLVKGMIGYDEFLVKAERHFSDMKGKIESLG